VEDMTDFTGRSYYVSMEGLALNKF